MSRNMIGLGAAAGICALPAAFYASWYWLLIVVGCVVVIAGGFIAAGEHL